MNEDNQQRAGDEEGIAALVKLLRREAASDELLESACIAGRSGFGKTKGNATNRTATGGRDETKMVCRIHESNEP